MLVYKEALILAVFVFGLLGCIWVYLYNKRSTEKPTIPGKMDPQELVLRYTGYEEYQLQCMQWSGYEDISLADLQEMGFTQTQCELLFHRGTNLPVGGFGLATGFLPDWPLIKDSDITARLVGSKFSAIDVIVGDDYRRQGLADYMVRKIVQSYGGLRHLMWNAHSTNEASLRLAKRYGFVEFANTIEPDSTTVIHLIRKAGGR